MPVKYIVQRKEMTHKKKTNQENTQKEEGYYSIITINVDTHTCCWQHVAKVLK